MELREVAASLRRRYYEAAYRDLPVAAVLEAATPEQAIALGRTRWPGASDRRLLELSGVARLRQLAASMAATPRAPAARPLRFHLERRPAYDVNEALRAGHERVSLQYIKSVTNIVPDPSAPTKLRALWLSDCGGEPKAAAARHPLLELGVSACGDALERAALASFAAETISLQTESPLPLDAARLAAEQATARSVSLTAARLENVRALRELPAATAALTRVQSVEDVAALLAEWRERIEDLTLGTAVPLPPDILSPCRGLLRLRLEARAENADAWIDWATDHPEVAVQFVTDGSITLLPLQVVELHRGVPVLARSAKAAKLSIESDLVDLFDLPFDDNGALEDALKKVAKRDKKDGKKIAWASEASTFVARVADLETARWLVDAALATKA